MKLTFTETLESVTCAACGICFAMPHTLVEKRRGDGKDFFCPNGHTLTFGESDADKLRRERDRLQQRLAEKDDDIRYQRQAREVAERRLSAAKGQITKIKKRVHGGVCPCCNRTFADLARHMAGQHPGFVAEPDAADRVLQ